MKRNTLPTSNLTRADAEAIVAGFLADRRAKHGDLTMTGGLGEGAGGGDAGGTGDNGTGGDAGAGGSSTRPAPTDPTDPNYFPANTSVAEMSPQHQAAYHRYQSKVSQDHQRELERELAALRPKATEYDELVAATRSEGEVAIDEALEIGREEGRAEVRQEVAAEFLRQQLSSGRTADAVEVLMRGVNPAGFLNADGRIDYPAIRAFATTLGGGTDSGQPDLGNGRRGGTGKPSVAGGRSLYEQTHPTRAAASTSAG